MAELERIDRFEVVEPLGAGGFATVWLARDPVLDLQVAIKVLADNWSRDPAFRKRFIEEAKVLWQTNSPRIVRVHHVGEMDDGRPYFVMAWANRGTLHRRIDAHAKAGTTFTVPEACAISAEIARAVGDVHDGGRIHRDIKPGNILITSTESRSAASVPGLAPDEQLVLADFGLARSIDASAITFISGSPAYVAPEQARGLDQLNEKVDLFPIGLIATELLTGSLPTDRTSMHDAASTAPIDVAGHLARCNVQVPPQGVDLLQRLLDPDPAGRPRSAAEAASTFEAIARSQPLGTTPPGPVAVEGSTELVTPPTTAPGGQPDAETRPAYLTRPAVIAAIVAIVIVAVGGLALLFNRDDSASTAGGETTTSVTEVSGQSTTQTTTQTTSPSSTLQAATASAGGEMAIPLPEIAVLTSDGESELIAAIAAPQQDVIDFYYDQTHPGWTVGPLTVDGDETMFRMTSDSRTADVTINPTAQGAGPDIVQIAVIYESR